jgi:hypothetical protein
MRNSIRAVYALTSRAATVGPKPVSPNECLQEKQSANRTWCQVAYTDFLRFEVSHCCGYGIGTERQELIEPESAQHAVTLSSCAATSVE